MRKRRVWQGTRKRGGHNEGRKRLRECLVPALDFAKAFDTVFHGALVRVLCKRGLPGAFCAYITNLNATAETVLAVDGICSAPVRIGQGVRQGDTLSPLLLAWRWTPYSPHCQGKSAMG